MRLGQAVLCCFLSDLQGKAANSRVGRCSVQRAAACSLHAARQRHAGSTPQFFQAKQQSTAAPPPADTNNVDVNVVESSGGPWTLSLLRCLKHRGLKQALPAPSGQMLPLSPPEVINDHG